MVYFKHIIDSCKFLQKAPNTTVSRDAFCSISYLLKGVSLTHSNKIKLGSGLEHFTNDLVKSNVCGWEPLNWADPSHQIDSLFINKNSRNIICAEYKSNMALDSQKRDITYTRNMHVHSTLAGMYPGFNILTTIVNLRFLTNQDIPDYIINRYNKFTGEIKIKIVGINDYLGLFGIQGWPGYQEYTSTLEYICKQTFIGWVGGETPRG